MRIRALRAEGWRNLEPLTLRAGGRGSTSFRRQRPGQDQPARGRLLPGRRCARSAPARASELIQLGRAAGDRAAGVPRSSTGGLERRFEVELRPTGRKRCGSTARRCAAGAALRRRQRGAVRARGPAAAAGGARRPAAGSSTARSSTSSAAIYAEASAYQKVLKSRNALLRKRAARPTRRLLETYDEQLARTGARLVMRRRGAGRGAGAACVASMFVGAARRAAGVDWPTAATPTVAGAPSDEADGARQRCAPAWRRGARLDERRGFTGFGPHTDDLEIGLAGRPAREHALAGPAALAGAGAQARRAAEPSKRALGEPPVLLLDDVASELDPSPPRVCCSTSIAAPRRARRCISVTERRHRSGACRRRRRFSASRAGAVVAENP